MKFFDTITIITKEYAPLNKEEPPLGYCLPGDLSNLNKTDKAKIDNAHRWASYYLNKEADRVEFNFSNKPIGGFRIGDVTKRYSTSNKFFRIIDPRGFELEISTENLNEILQTGKVEKGEILGPHVWTKNGRDWLCPADHPEYQKWLLPAEQRKNPELQPGDKIKLPFQGEMIFAGIWYLAKCREDHVRNSNFDYWNRYNSRNEPQYFVDIVLSRDVEPYYLFHYPDSKYSSTEFLARRKPKKFEFISSGNKFKPVLQNNIYRFSGNDYFYGMAYKTPKEVRSLDITKIDWPRESYYERYPVRNVRVEN